LGGAYDFSYPFCQPSLHERLVDFMVLLHCIQTIVEPLDTLHAPTFGVIIINCFIICNSTLERPPKMHVIFYLLEVTSHPFIIDKYQSNDQSCSQAAVTEQMSCH
jgi:hypothetical protein